MTHPEQLAINGGPKSVTNPIAPWPIADQAIKQALTSLIDSHSWGLYDGQATEDLQAKMQDVFGCPHSLLTCSGTMAVELALRGVGVKPGDEVVLAAYDFPGNFRAIEAIGAMPVLVDVVEDGWVIDVSQISDAVSEKTAAILVSHLHGQLSDLRTVRESLPREIPVVEDCCQVPGASVDGQPCGSFGDVSAFSFGGSKLLSAGRGGALLSEDESIVSRAKHSGSRGNDAFPLSQLQAAVLIPQLDELRDRSQTRQSAVEQLVDSVAKIGGSSMIRPKTQKYSAWYKLPWLLGGNDEREVVVSRLKAEGVPIDVGFRGFAKRTARRCRKVGDLKNAQRAAGRTVLLHHPALLESVGTRQQIVSGFEKVLSSLDG